MAERFVEYEKYCEMCKHYKEDETKNPCNDCLNNPVNEDSRKPIRFDEKDE